MWLQSHVGAIQMAQSSGRNPVWRNSTPTTRRSHEFFSIIPSYFEIYKNNQIKNALSYGYTQAFKTVSRDYLIQCSDEFILSTVCCMNFIFCLFRITQDSLLSWVIFLLPTHRCSAHRKFFPWSLLILKSFMANAAPGPRYASKGYM